MRWINIGMRQRKMNIDYRYNMGKNNLFLLLLSLTFFVSACHDKQQRKNNNGVDVSECQATSQDSTIYGVCGDGTMMHSLQLITDGGDTITFALPDSADGTQIVVGGLLAGDRLAVVEGKSIDGEKYARKVINLTTLQGKWTSIDKNFEILEGGEVKSGVEAEKNPWTTWKILNGKLLLNRDTFDIDNLGSDSLYLENKVGIFVYKRVE